MTDQTFTDPLQIFDHIDIAMVRDPKQYHYHLHGRYLGAPMEELVIGRDELTRIQLGAGFKKIDRWRNLEYPTWDADYPIPAEGKSAGQFGNSSMKQPIPSHMTPGDFIEYFVGRNDGTPVDGVQPDNSVHEIASYHTLDHLSPQQVVNTLREIERVLVPGGTFTNIVPHFDSTLAKECIWHQSRFGIDTFRNIFSERQYSHDGSWSLEVGLNFIFGLAERNTVLVTQLVKK